MTVYFKFYTILTFLRFTKNLLVFVVSQEPNLRSKTSTVYFLNENIRYEMVFDEEQDSSGPEENSRKRKKKEKRKHMKQIEIESDSDDGRARRKVAKVSKLYFVIKTEEYPFFNITPI